MTQRPTAVTGRRGELNEALLASLGLPPDASPAAVQATRDRLTAFLADAPPELRTWAAQQVAAAEAACALLLQEEPARALPAGRGARVSPVLVLLLILGVVSGVYFLGDSTPSAQTSPTATATAPTLDEARVATLEDRVAADPEDVAAMRELGELHYAVGDFTTAASWQRRILEVDPEDVDAHLALGVASFNTGDLETAETHWKRAAELDPGDAAVHYNLGFLYMSMDPPRIDDVRSEWTRVIELAPGTDLAATAAAHLGRLDDVAPSPEATP